MKLAVIEYNAGNVQSVLFALKRLGIDAELSSDPKIIGKADKIIFPGVGEASSAMRYLRSKNLGASILSAAQPFLGICLGLHLLCAHSEEGNTAGLGVFKENIKKFTSDGGTAYKIPHIGWNNIYNLKGGIFKNIPEHSQVYFVHSYYAPPSELSSATCGYAQDFSAALERDNYYAVQFHPEKSGDVGAEILRNFVNL